MRAEDRYNERATQAWLTAVLNNQKKMPPLEKVLTTKERTGGQHGQQAVGQQRAVVEAIAAAYKLKTRKATKKKTSRGDE